MVAGYNDTSTCGFGDNSGDTYNSGDDCDDADIDPPDDSYSDTVVTGL